jgi:CheY-like chemotaxis protein/glycine cleavage system H lipoate-binding protein
MEKKLNILVVDDEQIVLDSINKHLRKENYTVHGVLSVREAWELMETTGIDIVLTDLMMPHTDGLEFMKIIKEKYPNMPVIMITGYATINSALQATQLGAFDYIAKPFSKTELIKVIERAAELVNAIEASSHAEGETPAKIAERAKSQSAGFKTIGDKSWLMVQDDGTVLLGVERSFLHTVGRIQTVFLPQKGDELRQGSVYLQIFSSDMRSHTIISPLSGNVVDINEDVIKEPETMLLDPYGKGWLIRLKPNNFDNEIKLLGL